MSTPWPTLIRHATAAGIDEHRARGEQPCNECSAYGVRLARTTANQRALRELARRHPVEYRDLYKKHQQER